MIVDNFAGGGGASCGIELALGRHVDVAINHDPEAVAMHAINHPQTDHHCESVWDVDPVALAAGRPIGLAWFSPDCKHFSKAKGGTPVKKEIRGLAWVMLRWALLVRPRVMPLENVEEFVTWGPLIELEPGRFMPDPARKGETFHAFVAMLSDGIDRDHPAFSEACEFLSIDPDGVMAGQLLAGLGYAVDWRELRACDYGAPTIRKRLFLIARCDGKPIVWPEPTHGKPDSPAVKAKQRKPWRTAAECIDFSLDADSIFDRKKPLAMNTQRRVAKGLWRHVLTSAKPYIVARPDSRLVTPFLTEHANSSSQRTMAADEPIRTLCAQVKGGHFSVVAPTLAPLRGTSEPHLSSRSVEEPTSTVSAGGTHHALVSAHLITIGYGEREGQQARAQDIVAPLGTVVAANKHALTTAFFEQANGGFYDGDGRAADTPLSTIMSSGSNQRLVTAYLVKYYSSGGQWNDLNEPMHTLPTKGRMGCVQSMQIPVELLLPEQRVRARQCAQLLHEHLPEHFPEPADLILMRHDGVWWVLVDITLRMLEAHELYPAQGFPAGYVTAPVINGRRLPKHAQVRMCGNSVSPLMAAALIRANVPEMASWSAREARRMEAAA
ncbi:DNA cytosine methyltransferase [Cupriavidus basilensis]|uniref:DNA (cytosine-5-)-methyltransferase n=1 Tax=Cupriavidus basilensis TaxID=68895 RepID=A0A643G5N6_9BURK|nr:DNA cytosine methyltransferase [Cupriavidus basilensis]